MRIGITFDLKSDTPAPPPRGGAFHSSATLPGGGAGGSSPDDLQEEFDSPVTIAAISNVLRGLGHEVVELGDGPEMLQRLLADPPDFVFNFAEGHGVGRSREARVPAVLEMLGIPYSGSDPLTLAATLDKDVAKRLIRPGSFTTRPWGIVIHPGENPQDALKPAGFPFPAIVKPAWEGSSKGIRSTCIVEDDETFATVVSAMLRDYRQPVLLEEFISGDELTAGIVGNEKPAVIGVMRVVPTHSDERFIYSIDVKRDFRRRVRYECPPPYSPSLLEQIKGAALDVYHDLGCRDVARIDFRFDPDRGLFFLEANPLPGLHPDDSDLVILAKGHGWSYERLIRTIVDAAFKRYGIA